VPVAAPEILDYDKMIVKSIGEGKLSKALTLFEEQKQVATLHVSTYRLLMEACETYKQFENGLIVYETVTENEVEDVQCV